MKIQHIIFCFIIVFSGLCVFPSIAEANNRVALVIGNKDYEKAPLDNPIHDAADMKTALESIGFQVIYLTNADLPQIDEAVRKFAGDLNKDSIGLFYYSGHGAQIDGVNYLIPVHADIRDAAEMKARAYDASIILGKMEEVGNSVNLVILDACRDNPFKGARGGGGGLASMNGPTGSLIAFATKPHSFASDNSQERNGLYTKYLKRYITEPGLKIEEVFKKVRTAVITENKEQIPWEESSLQGDDLCLAGGCNNSTLVKNNATVINTSPVISNPPITHQPTIPIVPRVQIEMVALPTGIKMGKYEVTQGQWRSVMGTNPSNFQQCGDNCPVEMVSWNDVQEFIGRLNQQTGQHFRLPTDDEWYAACQATEKTMWHEELLQHYGLLEETSDTTYCGSDTINDVAWYSDNSNKKTHPVGMKQPNAWGLYDMSGNVWEWTNSNCDVRLCIRGGSWNYKPTDVGADSRLRSAPSFRDRYIGVRLAQDP